MSINGRHFEDQVMLALFKREEAYNQTFTDWAAQGCSMRDFDTDSAHELWDDLVEDNAELLHDEEYPTRQELVRQGLSLPYTEPRVKPNTMAGLLGLACGSVFTVADGAIPGGWVHPGWVESGWMEEPVENSLAFMHRIEPIPSLELPSIAAMTKHAGGLSYRYRGLKADGYALASAGPYLQLAVPLVGSGTREQAGETFPIAIPEPLLRWGDCRIYIKLMTSALHLPREITQGSTNLGAGAYEISTRIRQLRIERNNNIVAEDGYRPSSGKIRNHLIPRKRADRVVMTVDVDSDREAEELAYYLDQQTLALELNCTHSTVIDEATSTWKYGFILIIPCLKIRALPRGQEDEMDTLTFEASVLSDRYNYEMTAWVFNNVPGYLDGALRLRYIRLFDQNDKPWYIVLHAQNQYEVTDKRPNGVNPLEGDYHWLEWQSPDETVWKIHPMPSGQLAVSPESEVLNGVGTTVTSVPSPQGTSLFVNREGTPWYLFATDTQGLRVSDSAA